MRSSPRKMREESGVRVARCKGALPSGVESVAQLARLPIVELRHQATQQHGVRNAQSLGRAELVERLGRHFEASHGVVLEGEGGQVVIGSTIDRLRNRIRGGREVKEEAGRVGEEVEDLVMESEEEQVVPLQEEVEGDYIIEQEEVEEEEVVAESYTIHTEEGDEYHEEVEYEDEEEEEDEDDDEDGPSLTNMRYKIGGGEATGGQEMVVQVLPKAVST